MQGLLYVMLAAAHDPSDPAPEAVGRRVSLIDRHATSCAARSNVDATPDKRYFSNQASRGELRGRSDCGSPVL